MDGDRLWSAIDTQRVRTADLLDALSPQDWAAPTLCEGWTVRDVAAHLTLQDLGAADLLRAMLRHPGGTNHVIRQAARDKAQLPPERLVAELRGSVGQRRHNVGLSPSETLIDIVVHGQDIAVPLGRTIAVHPQVAVAAAASVWADRTTRLGRVKARVFRPLPTAGFRFTATDASWSAGEGREVRGPALALLLVLTGRPVALPDLDGDGVPLLAAAFERSSGR